MPVAMPLSTSQQVDNLADALNAWLPCPYPRPALLQWVQAHLVTCPVADASTGTSDEALRSMLREHYREWIDLFNEYRL